MGGKALNISQLSIRMLNDIERESIRRALEHYVNDFPGKASWSQKVLLDDMLGQLLWCSKLEVERE